MLIVLALLVAPAHAAPRLGADIGLGVVTGQPGADIRGRLTVADGGAWMALQLGLGMRTVALDTAVDEPPFPLVGLASLDAGWGVAVSQSTRIGPMGAVDAALLPAAERDCGGFGCRHSNWVGGTSGVGVSYAPAFGLAVNNEARGGNRFDVSFAVQPTTIYDIVVPIAPRVEMAWTHRDGWRLGARAHRYGVVLLVGAVTPG